MSVLAAGLIFAQLVGGGGAGLTSAFTVGDRTEARVRSVEDGTGNRLAEDLETTIISSYVLHLRRSEYILGYTPRLVYNDIEGGRQLSLLHTGHIGAAWWTKRLRLALTIDGAIGSQSAVGLAAPIRFADITTTPTAATAGTTGTGALPPPTVVYQPGNQLEILNLGTFRAGLNLSYVLSRRWALATSGYYAFAGGFDFNSQQAFPPNHGPGAEASLTYTISKTTQTSTRLRANENVVLQTPVVGTFRHTGGTFDTAELLESVRHSFSKRTQFSIGGGVSLLRGPRQIDGKDVAVLNAAGDMGLGHTVPLHAEALLALRASAALTSAYNPVLGIAQQQASAALSAAWTKQRISTTATAGFVASVPTAVGDSDNSKTASGSLVFEYKPAPILDLQAGLRGYWALIPVTTFAAPPVGAKVQTVATPPTTTLESQGLQWAAFLAVQVTAPPLEF